MKGECFIEECSDIENCSKCVYENDSKEFKSCSECIEGFDIDKNCEFLTSKKYYFKYIYLLIIIILIKIDCSNENC